MIRRIRKIKRAIRNLIFWFPTIIRDQDYDFAFMYTVLAKKLESMEINTHNWCVEGVEKDRLRIKTAKILCQRLANEIIYNARNTVFPYKNETKWLYYDCMRRQDIELLADYLKKYSLGWWD